MNRHSRIERDARLRQQDEALVAGLLQRDPQQQLQRDGQVGGAPAALRGTRDAWEIPQMSVLNVSGTSQQAGKPRFLKAGSRLRQRVECAVGRLHVTRRLAVLSAARLGCAWYVLT